mmetsp:Transcript_15932/g.20849  ORF Transcript_15932/g.20849 Transcript_15932/m.20849 type:complete len:258 (-) Transcript_15932:3800-4573(-)
MHRSTAISHTSIERLTPPFTDRAWFPHHRPSQGSSSSSSSGGLSDCDELTMVEHRQSLHKASIREKLAPKPFGMQSKSGNATALYGAKPMLYAAADVDGGDCVSGGSRMEYSSSGRSSSRRQPIRSPPSDSSSHHHYGRMNMIGNNYRTSSSFLMEESEASGVLREEDEEEDEDELYVPSPTRARVGTVDDETAEELVALSMVDASSSMMRTELDSDDDNDEGVGVNGRRSGERGDRTSESLIGVSTMDMSASSSFL